MWRELIRSRCGHALVESRVFFLERRLWDRMRQRGLSSYAAYHRFISLSPGGEAEWAELLEELLNRETSFFRHRPSFEVLATRLLPSLLQEKGRRGDRTLGLWSAGCSDGAEPYSMAMAVLGVVDTRRWDVQILASDLSRRALERARSATYKEFELRTLPEEYRGRYFSAVGTNGSKRFEIRKDVAALVRFERSDVRKPRDGTITAEQDVIFCQNVLIYFEPADRVEAVKSLAALLRPGGYLVLAPGEMVGLRLPEVKPAFLDDVLVYQRTLRTPPGVEAESER